MLEYPSIINSSKAPRKACVAFDKLDGSNIRIKYTQKAGFSLFGTRTQLIDEDTPFWGQLIPLFNEKYAPQLLDKFKKNKDYRDYREIIVFGELIGPNSFAGRHAETDKLDLVFFDVLTGHKNRKFVPPKEFIKHFGEDVPIPKVIYEGNLNDQFIADIRVNKYGVNEGVICKGLESSGAFSGGVWMCKIKTQAYFDRLKQQFQENWEQYAE